MVSYITRYAMNQKCREPKDLYLERGIFTENVNIFLIASSLFPLVTRGKIWINLRVW